MSNQPPQNPYDGQRPGGFDSAPQMPGGGMHAPANVTKPKSIDLAVKLMYVGAGLALLGVVFSFLMKGSTEDMLKEQLGAEVSQSELDAAMNAGMIFAVVFGLIIAGIWVLMAKMNEAGKSWARIVATVLGALSILFTVIGFTQATPMATKLLNVVSLLLAVGILFLLWKPESTQYYNAKSGNVQR